MNSYDIGTILGHAQAGEWIKSKKPISVSRKIRAAKNYFDAANLAFIDLVEQDFIDGFHDGVESTYKGQLVKLESVTPK